MTIPAILALATGLPASRYSQSEVLDYLQPLFSSARHSRAIFRAAKVAYRSMVVDRSFYTHEQGTQARNECYMAEALPLGLATIQRCLQAAGCEPQAVDDFFVVSCTGLDIPGLDLRLAGQLGMRSDLRRTCVLGMGCYGASPALWRAREAVEARPDRIALVLAIELCSIHMQMDDSLENMVTSALFADGAAAALIGAADGVAPRGGGQPRMIDAATHCDYTTFDHMAFHITDHGFQMRLSSYVPDLLAADVEDFVDTLLGRNSLRRGDVRFWGIHPGGSKILDHIQSRLALTDAHLDFSHAVLREHGNMSSPTILFVLDEIQRRGAPVSGDYGVLLTFGPGLTMEGILLQW